MCIRDRGANLDVFGAQKEGAGLVNHFNELLKVRVPSAALISFANGACHYNVPLQAKNWARSSALAWVHTDEDSIISRLFQGR